MLFLSHSAFYELICFEIQVYFWPVVPISKKVFLNRCYFDAAFSILLPTQCLEVFLIDCFSGKNDSMLILGFVQQ